MKNFTRFAAACGLAAAAFSAQAATFVGDRTDFRDETIYFAMTTRFYDGDPMNNVCSWDKQAQQIASKDPAWRGDFKGLIDKLDYIKALGFTAIWITPVVQNASGIDYHGYHAMDFSKVDLRYESRKEWGCSEDVDFQDLIDAAHAKGMKIILDIVLQHTGNFGENKLVHLFDRNQNIRNQANIEACMLPDNEKLGGAAYWNFKPDGSGSGTQYGERFKYMKNTDGQNHDNKNYFHHVSTSWNWDLPNRWWGQIAGDCVDLNTENPAVVDYLVECYGKFIEMGVDGFRIDTTGHIAPLTFNAAFIPKFVELGEKYKSKRLNEAPFYMFGECCARFGGVIYRGQHVLSSHYYTWKSDPALVTEWKQYDAEWWAKQNVPEGAPILGNMTTCESDPGTVHNSDNVFLKNGAWHEPDYSQASGFNVIDFPMHYNFNDAGSAVRIANEGDHFYNDASWNVVYVDSHDYCPGPNDGVRFSGGTSQWAENLALMFTFRGIPCIYYGSEVEFQKGKIIDDGMNTKLSETGRAYFGHYLEGSVDATDFADYTATGQVAKTLNGDLAHHIQQLNKIRAAVPALRKGQYTFDDCKANGGWAFKRAYKNESYVLVAVNGGATFSNVPAGTYTDIVTGKTYNGGGTITVDAPNTQGQLRVLVKDWKGGKVVDDGKFIYASSPVAKGGDVTCTDPGTDTFYTKDDAVDETVGMTFSPNGGSFKTETLTVTANLTAGATSGTIKVGNQAQQTIKSGETKTFTVGEGMSYGESVTVTWTATGKEGNANGSVTYKKVDPSAGITIYVTAPSAPYLHAWEGSTIFTGSWPGSKLSNTEVIDGKTFYYMQFTDVNQSLNIIFNNGSGTQTGDITGITEDTYFEYDGGNTAKKIEVNRGPKAPTITATPGSGTQFNTPIQVTLNASPATDIYYTLDGSAASTSSTKYTGPITISTTTTINAFARNEVGETRKSFTYTYVDGPIVEKWHAYFQNDGNWSPVYAYAWDDNRQGDNAFTGKWPGTQISETVQYQGKTLHHYVYTPEAEMSNPMIIFNNNAGQQMNDTPWENNAIYGPNGKIGAFSSIINSVSIPSQLNVYGYNGQLVVVSNTDTFVTVASIDGKVRTLNVTEGTNTFDLPKGFYICNGVKVIL